MSKIKLGFCLCGSFCTIAESVKQMKILSDKYEIIPIISEIVSVQDTRFGKAEDLRREIISICGREPIVSIAEAEPIGPKNMTDIMIISPCTGNTMAKLATGIVDTTVTMAAKSHLRNSRPLLIAPATNDALGAASKNIGALLNYKNYYFVPYGQDDKDKKPKSMVADFKKIPDAIEAALKGIQLQPIVF